MQIKNMPEQERPKEKMLFGGAQSLSNSELLALVIRTGTNDKSAVGLAEEVLSFAAANIGDLGRADVGELVRIPGIGTTKACAIVAAIELSKRLMSENVVRECSGRIDNVTDVAKILMHEMMYEKRELFVALFLNTKLRIESRMTISIGSLDAAPVHPREVFCPAIKRGAAGIIVAHNHPSGDPSPSQQDIDVTERLLHSSEILGIKLVDHVIIGKGSFVSLRTEGYIPG